MIKRKTNSNGIKRSIKNKNYANTLKPLAVAIAITLSGLQPIQSQAATYTVANTNDSGFGSLRAAVRDANEDTPNSPDNIVFNVTPGSVINLQSELEITDDITITGPTASDASSIILDGGGNNRLIKSGVLYVGAGSVTLENITLRNGSTDAIPGRGGAIYSVDDINLDNVLLSNNNTQNNFSGGAGVYVRYGNVTITNSTISGNSTAGDFSYGGGIGVNQGDLTLVDSNVTNNSSISDGGGIRVLDGDITITRSIISSNTGQSRGGGVYHNSGNVIISQSTISNNSTLGNNSNGGGIFLSGSFNAEINESNITGNLIGGGIHTNSDLIINQSTISGNDSTNTIVNNAGGIFAGYSDLTVNQSTVVNNTASIGAGGIHAKSITLNQSTITNNTSTSGAGGLSAQLSTSDFTATINNTILAGNIGPEGNFQVTTTNSNPGPVKSVGSLFGDDNSEITDPTSYSNYFSDIPNLGPLQNNGGLTQTLKPQPTSPVINNGVNNLANNFSNDQRGTGFSRTFGTTVDIGAVELQSLFGSTLGEVLTRGDMAREILRAYEKDENYIPLDPSNNNQPYHYAGIYNDVNANDLNAVFIEELQRRGLTEGCDTNKYCPNMVVTKEQMAQIMINTYYYLENIPDHSTDFYLDVPDGSFGYEKITLMKDLGFSMGCDSDNKNFCPKKPVTREWFNSLLGQFL